MHSFDDPATIPTPNVGWKWWTGLTRYHWLVFTVAALGWLFDTMDQQLFVLARKPAVTYLLHTTPSDPEVEKYSGYATTLFMVGWAFGGILFGILGDRLGRVKTMAITVLVYSMFTGLSAFSQGVWDFAFYRFLTGLGVGGEFAVGVSLVAEVMPDYARPHALGLLQALSAVGNITAALVNLLLGYLVQARVIGAAASGEPSVFDSAWKIMFMIGVLPALLVFLIMTRLKEPERWRAASADKLKQKLGSVRELFSDPRWRHHTIVGMVMALSGVVGLWAIGFYSSELLRNVFRKSFVAEGMPADLIDGKLTMWVGIGSILLNTGAFFGIYAFSQVSHFTGRKPAFALAFLMALVSTAFTFWFLQERSDVIWMLPIMGFCQLSLFGGYAIYFPELFPTRLRSTGISFCYNVGRLVAAPGATVLGLLTSEVYKDFGEPIRYAGVTMCSVFLIGLIALPFAPETRGKPLPE